ncbi:delta-60 repeat domain-containing protein [Malonomonas rubra DSM 5091]|uniref:Delta-60 repeat domain-containing protein n=1 Tax=Malonomonas rubra DSM 5091 TaxID=1122189 RepID=A0A1M6H993_MALRU|nr:Ig-like domain-containing protein [Malonomonas rubra]SHJ18754.1 delta-60 repeat domain-containing protein [Malonomonas rubra DSM 5091]
MKFIKILLFAVVCFFPLATFAETVDTSNDPPRDPFYSQGVELDSGPSMQVPLERVDPFSGNLSIVHTDIELPGNGGLDLKIMRYYDSAIWGRRDQPIKTITAGREESPLGLGWYMHMGIIKNPRGTGSSNRYLADNPIFELPDGSRHIFYKDKNNPDQFISNDLWIMKRVGLNITVPTSETTWEVISPEGMIYTAKYSIDGTGYEVSGDPVAQVTKIENPSQTASISIEYTQRAINGLLEGNYGLITRIIDSTGRIVNFTYDSNYHQLKNISVAGLSIDYIYEVETLAVNAYRSFLREVHPTEGTPWLYEYDMSDPTSPLMGDEYGHELIRMTYPTGGQIEYDYSDVMFDTGMVDVGFSVITERSQYDRGGALLGNWYYSYNSGSSSGATTTVSAPNGVSERHTYYGWGSCPGDDCNGTVWKIGKPLKTEVIQGSLSEVTEYVWTQGATISNDTTGNPSWNNKGGWIYDPQISLPQLAQKKITRNGFSYTTNYSDFDNYANPREIVESGHLDRTRNLTYWYNTAKNIVAGKIDYETITGSLSGSFSIDNQFLTDGRLDYSIRFGVRTDYGYDSNGNINSITDANQNTTTYVWDKGRVRTITKPISGYSISRTINDNGTIASETNGRGYATAYLYDGNLRLTRITPPSSSSDPSNLTTISYEPDSSKKTVLKGGFSTEYNYDGFGRQTSSSNTAAVTTSTEYAAYGYKLSDDSNIGDKVDYDFFGRPTRVTHLGSEGYYIGYAYSADVAGSLVTVTDEAGKKTVYTYHSFGSPDEQLLKKVVDAKNYSTSYDYNILGSLTDIAQPGLARSYTYYPTTGFLWTETHPETGTITYTRDSVGNIDTKRDSSNITWDYTFDAINRLKSIENLSTGSTLNYDYDLADNRTSVVSPSANITIGFDPVNRPTSKTETISGRAYSMGFDYDGNDNLTAITYPNGRVVDYTYNTKNQINTVPGYIDSPITHTLAGQPEIFTYNNGVQNDYSYNARFVTDRIQAGSLLDLQYQYDSRGNTNLIMDNLDGSKSQDFSYDELNRLMTFNGAWGAGAYGYDPLGNRTSKTINGNTSSYTVNSGTNYRLTSIAGPEAASYGYDNTGKATSGSWGGDNYLLGYDDHSNLNSVQKNGLSAGSYAYDADGQRVVKTAEGETTVYHYGLDGNVLAETAPDGTLLADYVYLYGKLMAKIMPDTDGDGVGDSIDNCVSLANADQLNADDDALGDLCDSDDDNDGIEDQLDPYPFDDGMVVRPTPESITASEQTSISILIDDLASAGEEVLFEQIFDTNENGAVDFGEPVVRSFRITDGAATSAGVVGDTDGVVDGRISLVLPSYDALDRSNAPGSYLLQTTTGTEVAVYSFTVDPEVQAQTLAGTLNDGSSPVVGAYVQLLDKWQKPVAYALTDKLGNYLFNVEEPGDYLVAPMAFGYTRDLKALNTVAVGVGEQVASHDLSVLSGGYQLSGSVTVQDAGVSGLLVVAESERYVGYALTDADGNYSMQLPVGGYSVRVAVEGSSAPALQGYLVPATSQVAVNLSADYSGADIALEAAIPTVSGYVLDQSSNPVVGIAVYATQVGDDEPQAWAVTDASGAYSFGLVDGDWKLALGNEYSQVLGYVSDGLDVTIAGGNLTDQIIVATDADAAIEGVVQYVDGRMGEYLPVIISESAGPKSCTVKTAVDGSYRAVVSAGDWAVKVVGIEQSVSVTTGQIAIADITGPSVLLESPNGGELLVSGEIQTISWFASGEADNSLLEYRLTPAAPWKEIAAGVTETSYSWTVPPVNCSVPQSEVRVTVFDANGVELVSDISDDYFVIMESSCPAPYEYEPTTGQCESPLDYASPPCSDGGTLNVAGDMCEITTPECPAGYSYNFSRNQCEKDPDCGSGTYDSGVNQCVSVTQESIGATANWTCTGKANIGSYFSAECTTGTSGSCRATIDENTVGLGGRTWESGPIYVDFEFDGQCEVTWYRAEWPGSVYGSRESEESNPYLTYPPLGSFVQINYQYSYFSSYYYAEDWLNLFNESEVQYSCPSAEYVLSGTTCTRDVDNYYAPSCTMDYSVDKCYADPSCPGDYDLVLANDLCQDVPIIASPPCSNGGVVGTSGECELVCSGENNIPPIITGQNVLETDENVSLAISLSNLQVDDPEGSYPFGFTLSLLPGSNYTIAGLTIIPDLNFNGTLTVPVTVNDGFDESSIFDLSIIVNGVNNSPAISGTPTGIANPDTAYAFSPIATDLDGDTLSFTIVNKPYWANFDSGSGTLSGLPVLEDSGIYAGIVISVTDGLETVSLPAFDLEVRLPEAGDMDASFGVDGVVAGAVQHDSVIETLALSGDQVLVLSKSDEGVDQGVYLVRYNSDGSLDSTFGSTGKVAVALGGMTLLNSMTLQPDGKILVVGESYSAVTKNDILLIRFTADGSLDSSFGGAGYVATDLGAYETGSGVVCRSDGKIYVSGDSKPDDLSANDALLVIAYNSDGSLDTQFGGSSGYVLTPLDGFVSAAANSLLLDDEGKIIVAGTSEDASVDSFTLVRYGSDGNLDTSFGSGGIVKTSLSGPSDLVCAMPAGNGKTNLVGEVYPDSGTDLLVGLSRINNDGSLDIDFGSNGQVLTQVWTRENERFRVRDCAVQRDGKLVVAGLDTYEPTGETAAGLVRYDQSGALDSSFGTNGILLSQAEFADTVVPMSDGSLFVAGGMSSEETPAYSLTCYLAGTLGSLLIEGGSATTESTNTQLDLWCSSNGNNCSEMRFSPDGGAWSVWEPYSATKTWQLSDGGGLKTAYVQYRDGYGTTTPAYSDSITMLGNIPPVIVGQNNITIAEDSSYTVVFDDLTVEDTDSSYPADFVMTIADGSNYALNGNEIVPADDYYGELIVPVYVNDGFDNSNVYNFSVSVTAVNDAPKIADTSFSTFEETLYSGTLPVATDTEGSALTYALVSAATGGSVVVNADGSFEYTPHDNFSGSDSFIYSATDDGGLSGEGLASITVTGVNDAPTSATANIVTNEDTVSAGTAPLVIDSDSGDTHTFIIETQPASGFASVIDSKLTYSPNENFNGADSFTFRATDAGGLFVVGTAAVTVTAVNDQPVASIDSITAQEDTLFNGTLPAGSDVDGDPLTYSLVMDATSGTVTMSPDGSYSYDPLDDFSGSDSFSYLVNDGLLDSSAAVVTITVNAINDAPIAVGGSVSTDEDVVLVGTLPVGSDTDGDSLTYQLATDAANGTVIVNADGSYSYTPIADFNGSDSFTYTVNDAVLDSAAATMTVSVVAVNDAPASSPDTIETTEDVGGAGTLSASDVDADTLTFILVDLPTNGTVDLDALTGAYTYTPNDDFSGADSFTYKVNDGVVDSAVSTVSITVTNVNDAPFASAGIASTPEDSTLNGTLPVGSDADGDSLTYLLVAGATNGSVTVNLDGSYSYTPTADFNGSDSFTYKVNDGAIDSAAAQIDLTITSVNDIPTSVTASITTNEDVVSAGVTPAVVDPDLGDTHTFTIETQPTNGLASVVDGKLVYDPSTDFSGGDSFTFKATDSGGLFAVGTAAVTVVAVNDQPVASTDSVSVQEDTLLNGTLPTGTDVDGDSLTYSLVTDAAFGTVTVNSDGSYTYAPLDDFNGSDSFSYLVNDGFLDSADAVVTITVNAINDAPAAADGSVFTDEDVTLAGTLPAGSDVDGDALTYQLFTDAANGTVIVNTDGSYDYTPLPDFNGSDSFIYTVNDGVLDSSVATITVTVAAINDAPASSPDTVETTEEVGGGGTLPASDVDADTLTFILVDLPTNGTVDLDALTGAYTYTPNFDFYGADSFTYKVNDGVVDSAVSTVSITVTNVNDAPVASAGNASIQEDTTLNGTLPVGSDADGDSLTYLLVTGATNGSVTVNLDGSYSYTPTADFNGADSFAYKVSDGVVDSAAAQIDLTITSVNDAPISADGTLVTSQDVANSNMLTGSDIDGDSLTFSVVAQATSGAVVIDNAATGAYTYTPNTGYVGSDSFSFKVNDGTVDSSTSVVTITVTGVNSAPTSTSATINTVEDVVSAGVTPVVMDADAGDTHTFTIETQPLGGTANVIGNQLIYDPTSDFNGADSFTFRATDSGGLFVIGTASVTVTPVNDAPQAFIDSVTTSEGVTFNSNLPEATDVDGDSLGYSLVTAAEYGSVVVNVDGSYSYVPNVDFNGSDSFSYLANDGTVDSNIAVVTVTVTPVNDAPVSAGDSIVTDMDVAFDGQLIATDIDVDPLTYTIVIPPANGSVTLDAGTGSYTFTPDPGFVGSDSFSFVANDGVVDSNVSAIDVTVNEVGTAFSTLWTVQDGSVGDDLASAVTVDDLGTIYAAVNSNDSLHGLANSGAVDGYLVAYDATGNYQHAVVVGTINDDHIQDLVTDTAGNVVVVGTNEGGLAGTSDGVGQDIFVAKYAADGSSVWPVAQYSAGGDEEAIAVSVDASRNIQVAGSTVVEIVKRSGRIETTNSILLIQYDQDGVLNWESNHTIGLSDTVVDMVTDQYGNIYVVGSTVEALDAQINNGLSDAYIVKFDSSGNRLWTKLFGTSMEDFTQAVTVDSSGNIYLAGETYGSVDGQPNAGASDFFVAKFDSSGTSLGLQLQGGTADFEAVSDVAVDSNGNIFVFGSTKGRFDGGATDPAIDNAFFGKYDKDGVAVSVLQYTNQTDNSDLTGSAMAVEGSGDIVLLGSTAGMVDQAANAGGFDYYFKKLKGEEQVEPPPVALSITIDQVATPTTESSQLVTGIMTEGATVSVSVDTAAVVGAVNYPSLASWECLISDLAEGTNTITATAEDGVSEPVTDIAVIDYAPVVNNTIKIIKAEYYAFKSSLTVYASSALGIDASLVLDGYGNMVWDGSQSRWEMVILDVPAAPSSVTVSGPEGSVSGTVSVK